MTSMTHSDIMAYLRHGDNTRAIRETIDSMIKDGYEQTIKTFRSGSAADKKDAQEFLENVITKHKKEQQGRVKSPRKKTPNLVSRVLNSDRFKEFTYPRNLTHTKDDIIGLSQGASKTIKGAYKCSSGLMNMTIGTAQFTANALAIARKSFGVSDAVFGMVAIGVIAQAINWTAIQEINLPVENAATYETHADDFCANPNNLNGNTLSAVFSRAHYAPGTPMQAHYKSAMQGEKTGVPPIALMMIQAMETGFYDVQGSGDAQGLYQNQVLDFLEKTMKYAAKTPLYQDVENSIANNQPVPERDLMVYDTLNIMLARLDNSTPDQRVTLRNDLSDGRLSAYERAFLDLRNDTIFTGQLMGVYLYEQYPELRTQNLPDNPQEQLNSIKNAIYDVYQDHLMGPTGAIYYNALRDIDGLKLSDTSTAQTHADILKDQGVSVYRFSASSMYAKAEQNPGPFDGLSANTTYADGYESFTSYIDQKTSLAIAPVISIMGNLPVNTSLQDAFAVCVKTDNSGNIPEQPKTTRLKLAMQQFGL